MTWRWGKPMRYMTPLPEETKRRLEEIRSPSERMRYMRALREAGWTLRAVAEAAGVSNSLVAHAARHAERPRPTDDFHVPEVPRYPDKPSGMGAVPKLPDLETTQRLLELMQEAQLVRGNSPRGRREAEEFTALLDKTTREGVSLYQLAKLLGTTRAALHGRLVRYGYKTTTGSSVIYTPVKRTNRPEGDAEA